MIVCKNCGHQNDDNDTFCGSCGKFLEWTGERIAVAQPEPDPPPPPAAPAGEPTHVGLIDRVKHAVGIEETPVATPSEGPAAVPAPVPLPVAPAPVASATAPAPGVRQVPIMSPAPPSVPVAVTPVAGDAVPTREPVLAGVGAPATPPVAAPIREDEPVSRRPTSVAPAIARPRTAPRTLEAPTRHKAGDLICGQCGEGNEPTRHFCRRCGQTLDEAIAVQLPWYRRFLNRLFGVRTREAGWRPHRVGPPNVLGAFWRLVRLALLAIVAIAVLAFLLIPSFHSLVVSRVTTAVTSVRKIVHPNYDPIHPTGAGATSSLAGHLPGLAMDGYVNTYWAASAADRTPDLRLSFAAPTDLAEIGFTSGAAGSAPADQFLAQPRPHDVHLVFSDGTTQQVTLADQPKAQFFPLTAKQVTFVEIHILSVWPTAGPAPSSVAIAEVEFRIKD